MHVEVWPERWVCCLRQQDIVSWVVQSCLLTDRMLKFFEGFNMVEFQKMVSHAFVHIGPFWLWTLQSHEQRLVVVSFAHYMGVAEIGVPR